MAATLEASGQQLEIEVPGPCGNTYDKYATQNPVERALMANFMRTLIRNLPSAAPARVLEVGMGEGEVSALAASRFGGDTTVVGLDLPSAELAEDWKERGLIGAFADATRLPFPDDAFDLVLAIEVLEHVPDPDAMLREIRRVCAGEAILSVPREPVWRMGNMARGRYLRDLGNTPGHINHWGKAAFARLVHRHLDVVDVSSPFPWTMVTAQARPAGRPEPATALGTTLNHQLDALGLHAPSS